MIRFPTKKKTVQLYCTACEKQVSVPTKDVQLFVCLEDDWRTCVFTCPSCHCRRTQDAQPALLSHLNERGVPTIPWSVTDLVSPIVTDAVTHYKPRRVPSTWLAFDETDAVLLVRDMNTRDWFAQLAAYNPHVE